MYDIVCIHTHVCGRKGERQNTVSAAIPICNHVYTVRCVGLADYPSHAHVRPC